MSPSGPLRRAPPPDGRADTRSRRNHGYRRRLREGLQRARRERAARVLHRARQLYGQLLRRARRARRPARDVERMFDEGRDYVWRMDHVVETPATAAAEWTFSYVVTDVVPRSAGRKVRFRGMSVFELEGGRIARYREYFDTGVALLQLGFAPDSIAKVLGRRVG